MRKLRIFLKLARRIYFAALLATPLFALWLWWEDGMWSNGAMPTHGLVNVLAGCLIALGLHALIGMDNRIHRNRR